MKALVFHGPNTIAWEELPDARLLEPTDAVVRIDTTTICGTDLHILHGDVPAVTDGRVLGHDGVGTIVAVGDGGDVAFQDVQVGAADRRGVDPDDHVRRLQDLGIRYFFPSLLPGAVVDERLHD